MPGGSDQALGNEKMSMVVYLPAVPTPVLGANAQADNTFTVPGVLPLDVLSWNLQAPATHLVLDNIYVSAPGVITLRWGTDGTGLGATTANILLEITRATNANLGVSALPAAIV
jgi:hypothetical protein